MLINQDFAQFRAKSLGGSDIAAILGLSPYRTAVDVWLEKTGKKVNTADSLPLRFGSFAEEFVAKEYALQTQSVLLSYPHAITHPDYDYLGGHIDRFVKQESGQELSATETIDPSPPALLEISRSDNKLMTIGNHKIARLLECKTANPFRQQEWGDTGTDQVPLPYLCQCLWYMAITQMAQIDLAVLFGNSDFRIYQIHRDLQIEQTLLEKAVHFWQQHVLLDIPPPAQCEADYQALFRKEDNAKSIEAPQNIVEEIQKIGQIQERIEEAEGELSHIKQQIMASMQDAQILTHAGKTLATWKTPKVSTRLDTKSIELAHPELVAQFMVSNQSSRRLLIKSIKD
ncbi:hypothetical protein G6671_02410 [Polynucleobacter paneuropaeus]|nr:hypothetical protein G6671_02410 [Polynucleobacter paneuropaeus]